MKIVQYFNDEYLERCKSFTAEQILGYLENFRSLQEFNKEDLSSKLITQQES